MLDQLSPHPKIKKCKNSVPKSKFACPATAGKKRLAGDTEREANTGEVKQLRSEARDLKEVVAEQTLELRLLKKASLCLSVVRVPPAGNRWGRRRMRYPATEKLEIIRLVEQSHLPTKQTLDRLGVPRTTFYRWYDKYIEGGVEALEDKAPMPACVWNRIPDDVRNQIVDLALEQPALSPRELAVRFTDVKEYFVSEASVYRLLKAHDLITSPAFIVIKAANEFKDKTTAPNEMLLSAMLRIACRAKGRQILRISRLLDGAGSICRLY